MRIFNKLWRVFYKIYNTIKTLKLFFIKFIQTHVWFYHLTTEFLPTYIIQNIPSASFSGDENAKMLLKNEVEMCKSKGIVISIF